MAAPIEVVLFDFFGTLVHYEPDRTAVAYPRTHALLVEWGAACDHDEFVAVWDVASTELERRSEESHVEHSMLDIAAAYAAASGVPSSVDRHQQLVDVFLDDWCERVHPVEGAAEMVQRMARTHRLGIVSNTFDPAMVPRLMSRFGMYDAFELVLLSVDHGMRKPHPTIYARAAELLGCAPVATAFVGDTYGPDYAGPSRAGMHAYLIDPGERFEVPSDRRLRSVLDLEARLVR